jgi:hypothetical protein
MKNPSHHPACNSDFVRNQAKNVADFLESEAKKAVESYFAKPSS